MFGVDVGGTFTDVVAVNDGAIRTAKVPTDLHDTARGVLRGADEIGVGDASVFNHASTHGLNAVITRQLPKVAFLTTLGHRDILDMGRTWRPPEGLTNPGWRRSFGDAARPLVPRYLRRGVRERLTATGEELIPLDEEHAREQLAVLRRCAVEGVAICLLNSYVDGRHELRLRELVRAELGDIPVSVSSEVSPLAKEFARASTTVVDVLMKIIYGEYTKRLDEGLRRLGFAGSLNFADCAARLIPAEIAMEHPFRIVFAGPAAGTMSSAHFGRVVGARNLLCCDVGGTSCDISLVTDGEPFVDTTFELEHDLVVNTLSNDVSSIGAGGGSLVRIDSVGELRVGPGSAGAEPGPACYGLGGTQPTITDACLLAGILDPGGFAGGRMRLDPDGARAAFESLDCGLTLAQRVRYAFDIGVHNIAEGLFNVAIKRGIDPRDYSLIAYGAAGPMLLPAVLEQMRARELIIPPYPGLFSALGLVSSDRVYSDSRSAYQMLTSDTAASIDTVYRQMEEAVRDRLAPADRERAVFVRTFDGRLHGQTWETPFVEVPAGRITPDSVDSMIANFHKSYAERWGHAFEALPVQGVTYRVHAVVPSPKVSYPEAPVTSGRAPQPTGKVVLRHLFDDEVPAAEYDREALRAGDRLPGPAVVREPTSTTFVLPGQTAEVGRYGELHITKA
ncbi:N-methylhydantoinase A [Prauserella shujinwangii]|uniref:N-methylhydantoinase A n=1 Tax=Prauserella shujinwangii TaxID=1453103 RepID=A0A2T0M1L6_9PSEU|nr:hydantoinase/oxoprolinase family protein [Prauserella shujinwangii]PRX50461.1 N-methylhydantoinase A [Prauserella shujinwangii]